MQSPQRRPLFPKPIRAWLPLMAVLAVTLLPVLANAQTRLCPGPAKVLPRKPLHKLSPDEWRRFVAAVKVTMTKSTAATAVSKYDTYVKIHADYHRANHGFASFFPFHRLYLREFELLLQTVDPSVTIPYWDWSRDSQAPETSIVFRSDYFGGNGMGSLGCVGTGQFSTWFPRYPTRHCLNRSWDRGTRISSWYSTEMINRAISSSATYDQLRNNLEPVPLGAVHVNIGADFATVVAPNDPLYWVHHAYVDYLWDSWQWRVANWQDYSGRNSDGTRAKITDLLPPFRETVADVLDVYNMCYYYEEEDKPVSSDKADTMMPKAGSAAPSAEQSRARPHGPSAH